MNLYSINVLVRYGDNECACGQIIAKADSILEALEIAVDECINDYGVEPESVLIDLIK